MRVHPGVAARREAVSCRALVGGYGSPGCRDLDFGERFIRLAETLDWPRGVVVEDLSYSAHLVLHRLQELRPAKVILVGAVASGLDPPGTVRRYRVGGEGADAEQVHESLTEALGGSVALNHTLSVVRHFGGLPSDTVVLEVEAADASFGLGFSDELAAAIDPLLDAVRDELGDLGGSAQGESALPAALGGGPAACSTSTSPGRAPGGAAADAAPPGIDQLFQYAHAHAQVRELEALAERLPAPPGLEAAARFLPGDSRLGLSGDWYEVLTLANGAAGVVIADVAGARRLHAATVTAQLKMAVRALALLEGDRPASLLADLDGLVATTEVGKGSMLTYLTLDPSDRTLRVARAGHCPPLVLRSASSQATFVETCDSPALGTGVGPFVETVLQLTPGATLLVFTDGLVIAPGRPLTEGLRVLREAAEGAPASLEDLCDYVLTRCVTGDEPAREDDASVLAVRLLDRAVTATAPGRPPYRLPELRFGPSNPQSVRPLTTPHFD